MQLLLQYMFKFLFPFTNAAVFMIYPVFQGFFLQFPSKHCYRNTNKRLSTSSSQRVPQPNSLTQQHYSSCYTIIKKTPMLKVFCEVLQHGKGLHFNIPTRAWKIPCHVLYNRYKTWGRPGINIAVPATFLCYSTEH